MHALKAVHYYDSNQSFGKQYTDRLHNHCREDNSKVSSIIQATNGRHIVREAI